MAQQNLMDDPDDWAEFEAAPNVDSTDFVNNDLLPTTNPWTEFDAAPRNSAFVVTADSGINASSDSVAQQNLMGEWAKFEVAPIVDLPVSVGNDATPAQVETDTWTEFDTTPKTSTQLLIDENQTNISSDEKVLSQENDDWAGFQASPTVAAVELTNSEVVIEEKLSANKDATTNDVSGATEELREKHELINSKKEESFIDFTPAEETVTVSTETVHVPAIQTEVEVDPFAECDVVSVNPVPFESTIIDAGVVLNVKVSEKVVEIPSQSTPAAADAMKESDIWNGVTITIESEIISKEVEVGDVATNTIAEPIHFSDNKSDLAPATFEANHDVALSEQNTSQYAVNTVETVLSASLVTASTETSTSDCDAVICNTATEPNSAPLPADETSTGLADTQDASINIEEDVKDEDNLDFAHKELETNTLDESTSNEIEKDDDTIAINEPDNVAANSALGQVYDFDDNEAMKTEDPVAECEAAADETVVENNLESDKVVAQPAVNVENDTDLSTSTEVDPWSAVDVVGSNTAVPSDDAHIDSTFTDDQKESINEIESSHVENVPLNFTEEKQMFMQGEIVRELQEQDIFEVAQSHTVSVRGKEVAKFHQSLTIQTNISAPEEKQDESSLTNDKLSNLLQEKEVIANEAVPLSTVVNADTNANTDPWAEFEAASVSVAVTGDAIVDPSNDKILSDDQEKEVSEISTEVNVVADENEGGNEAVPLSQPKEEVIVSASNDEETESEYITEKTQPLNDENWDAFESAGVPNNTEIVNTVHDIERSDFGDQEEDDDWAGFEVAAAPAGEIFVAKQSGITVLPDVANVSVVKVEEDEDDWDGFESAPSNSTMDNTAVVVDTQQTEQHSAPIPVSSASAHVPVICSSVPIKPQEDMSQNEQCLFSLLQQLRSSRTSNLSNNKTENYSTLLSTVSHWQHYASLLQPSDGNVSRVCDDAAMPVLTVPVLLRSETHSSRTEMQPRHTQEDHLACVASSRATVTHLVEQQQQQQRQQDMDILDLKALDAQLERLHLLPHQLHLASHFTPKPVVSSDSSHANSSSFSFASATSASVLPVASLVLVRCGSGWQRKIARLSAVSMSMSHDTYDDPSNPTHGREAMLLNKQVSLTLQQASSSATNNLSSENHQNKNNHNSNSVVANPVDNQEDAEDDWGGFIDSSPAQMDTVNIAAMNNAQNTNDKEGSLSAPARAVLQQLPDLSYVLAT